MPVFVVVNPSNVMVDGVNAGSVTDVLDNHAKDDGSRQAVMTALQEWKAEMDRAYEDRIGRERTELKAQHAADLVAMSTKHEAAIQAMLAPKES